MYNISRWERFQNPDQDASYEYALIQTQSESCHRFTNPRPFVTPVTKPSMMMLTTAASRFNSQSITFR